MDPGSEERDALLTEIKRYSMGYMRWEKLRSSFNNGRTFRFAGPGECRILRGHTKSPIPAMLHCLNIPTLKVAPRSLSRVLPSAGSRFQWLTWSPPSRFPASSLPTQPGFQAATLRSCSTQPIQTTNDICLALIQLSTPDIVRQTTNNSNRASMTCKPRTSHHTALSHQSKPHNSALHSHSLGTPSATITLDQTTLHLLLTS